jgi:hypothetical protein
LDTTTNEQGVYKEEVKCEGCSGPKESLWRNCGKCSIEPCFEEKGYIACYECPGFEGLCAKYENLRKFCSNRGEDTKNALNRFKIGDAERARQKNRTKDGAAYLVADPYLGTKRNATTAVILCTSTNNAGKRKQKEAWVHPC